MASSPSALRQLPPAGTLLIAAVEVIVFINVNVGAAWYLFLPTCPLQFISDPVTNWYMLFWGDFLHAGILHILFNMLGLLYFGRVLEPRFGTLCFIGLVFLLGSVAVIVNSLIAYLASLTTSVRLQWIAAECAVGLSGVLFSMIIVEDKVTPGVTRSLFGFHVPNWAYPWVSVLVASLVFWNASIMGHLCGIIAGFIYSYGFVNFLTLKRSWIRSFESNVLSLLADKPFYVRCPERSPLPPSPVALFTTTALSQRRSAWQNRTGGHRLGTGTPKNANNSNPVVDNVPADGGPYQAFERSQSEERQGSQPEQP